MRDDTEVSRHFHKPYHQAAAADHSHGTGHCYGWYSGILISLLVLGNQAVVMLLNCCRVLSCYTHNKCFAGSWLVIGISNVAA